MATWEKAWYSLRTLLDFGLLAFLSTASHFDDDAAYSASNLILNLVIAMSTRRKWMAFDL